MTCGGVQWCSPFGLGPGVTVKKLESRGGEAERAFAVGVSVRAGRGRYRRTNIVTLTPRYQLHNNTPHRLQFAQKCTATTLVIYPIIRLSAGFICFVAPLLSLDSFKYNIMLVASRG